MGRGTGQLAVLFLVALSLLVVGVAGATAEAGDTTGNASMADDSERVRNATTDATAADTGGAVGTTPAQTNTITVEQEYRLTPGQPGRVDIQWQFTIPDNVGEISTRLPADATNPRKNGFEKTDDGYVWKRDDQSTTTPTLTYTTAVNETRESVSGPIGSDGEYLFVDTGDWALIEAERGPNFSLRYRDSEPAVVRTNTTAGDGVVGQSMVYLGPYAEYTRSAHDQQFRLVVPEAATLSPGRGAVFGTVTDASGRLRMGDRDRQVLMFAAPETIPWSVRGLQSGDRTFYAVADEPVDEPNNVWVHEYVHTRQDFETTTETRWVTEASAEYYAGLMTLEQGRIEFDDFRAYLSRGTYRQFSDVVLSDVSTWTGTGANYYTGALVTGELDRQLRLATDRSGQFEDVFRRFNQQSTAVSQSDLLDAVNAVGGAGPQRSARQYTETTEKPSVWSQDTHETAFAPLPARFTYALSPAGSDGLRVRGPYRNRTLGAEPLVTTETLVADINVTNVGGVEGSYSQPVTLDGEAIATLQGTLRGGASATETVERTFTAPGEYQLSVGPETLTVRVVEPGTATVRAVSTNKTTATVGENVSVRVDVRNDGDVPADGTITLEQDGTPFADRRVALDGGEVTTVTATARLTESGTTTFTAGASSVTVTVEEAPIATDGAGESTDSGESGPGFGVVGTLVALAALLLVGHRIE
ncbi:PGF-CTERM sorting domain-containing protein [Salinibaculum rarum]|uniref:PGF-CTERM sorting domain-containing protein n=1 Tax=Salinibaculum rarum TaxID=3058903 RepID=UPI00265E9329|nr:PGF-CTERM sorting domain-containing protein [Salinibaculum sp. KK48]